MGQHMQQLAETMTYTSTVSKQLHSSLLVEVMKDMQTHLEAMDPPFGPKYETYLKIVHQVAADIKCHGADICQLSHFFLVPSRYYRPRDADPELFYYLLGGWKKAFVSGEEKMRKHIKHLNRAMKHSNFMSFLLAEFVPAILQTGFRNFRTRASMIHLAYLPSLAHRIGELLNGEEAKATHFFRQVINLLRIIMNCLLARFEYTIVPMFWDPLGEERSVRTMVCYFWLEVTPYLMNHAQRVRDKTPEDEQLLQELDQPFLHYLKRMDERLDPPYECAKDWMIPLWPVEDGRYCADFEKALEDDISDVVIESGRARVKVGRDFHWVKLSTYDESIPTFNEALQFGRIGRHTTIPSVENKEIMNLMF
jgi:hypothetical protein